MVLKVVSFYLCVWKMWGGGLIPRSKVNVTPVVVCRLNPVASVRKFVQIARTKFFVFPYCWKMVKFCTKRSNSCHLNYDNTIQWQFKKQKILLYLIFFIVILNFEYWILKCRMSLIFQAWNANWELHITLTHEWKKPAYLVVSVYSFQKSMGVFYSWTLRKSQINN